MRELRHWKIESFETSQVRSGRARIWIRQLDAGIHVLNHNECLKVILILEIKTSARTWCTGKTQRDRVEREVGGSGWGIHVYPWLIHVNVWQKPLQYCEVISLQLIKKIFSKKKKKRNQDKRGSLRFHWMKYELSGSGNFLALNSDSCC